MAFLRHCLFELRVATGRAQSDPLPLAARGKAEPSKTSQRHPPSRPEAHALNAAPRAHSASH